MAKIPDRYRIAVTPAADNRSMVRCEHARFTVLTPQLMRLEYSTNGFMDDPSQVVWNRCLPTPAYVVSRESGSLIINTQSLELKYCEGREFSPKTLSIKIKSNGRVWRYGEEDTENLGGTARTLDQVSGQTKLEPGLVSRSGWALVDDSDSLIFGDDGWLKPRLHPGLDLYFFGYGNDYQTCLADYRKIAGQVPLIPRWALGNWWSRYWAYSQQELTSVVREFQDHRVPLSVCVVDMDWHITDVPDAPQKVKGWTGYTWNTDLFPDPAGLLAWLHQQGLKTTLNLHPADGVYPHEAKYNQFSERLGIDPETCKPIPFDIANPEFAATYFELLHHPEEERGVDFWWIDWQQGNTTSLPGLDPLWWLNHLHSLDISRTGSKRPFILSRWGGLGSHRYPIGFSGDAVVKWESLAFQPAFTATASNVGYGWWSHDIGGHGGGIEEPELYARWVQFGVFSPISRLHSSKNPFSERRPWGYDAEVERVTSDALRLRHALIPYLYTMAWLDHSQSLALVRPMYHEYPEEDAAYHCPNQYSFGTELLAAPFTSPAENDTKLASQRLWLPEGDWYQFFTGEHLTGGKFCAQFGRLSNIPVFARAGAIVPMSDGTTFGDCGNPERLIIHFFPGGNRQFELYEDDGTTNAYLDGHKAITQIRQQWQDQLWQISIQSPKGDIGQIPARREYSLFLHNINPDARLVLSIDDHEFSPDTVYEGLTETLIIRGIALLRNESLRLSVTPLGVSLLSHRDRRSEKVIDMLKAFYLPALVKRSIARELPALLVDQGLLEKYSPPLTLNQKQALLEVLKNESSS